MKVWIARDKVKLLWSPLELFISKPEEKNGNFWSMKPSIGLYEHLFPDILPGECREAEIVLKERDGNDGKV